MNTVTNTNVEYKPNSLRKKSSFRPDGSYQIFHITRKQKEESDDDDDDHLYIKNIQTINKENNIKSKHRRKSFKMSHQNDLDGWRRKSSENKRLLFLHKTSCESTSNDAKTPPSSSLITNDLSQSITSNDAASGHLISKDKKQHGVSKNIIELSESDVVVEANDGAIDHNNATLNNLLARADQLETTVKQQDFNKIQRISRTSVQRKRTRMIIACSTLLITLIIIITIVIFVVIIILRYKSHVNQVSKSKSIYDLLR